MGASDVGLRANRPFSVLMAAYSLSSVGSSVLAFALPVVYLRMTGSLVHTALIATFEGVATLLSFPLVGVIVDAHSRVHLMRISQISLTMVDMLLFTLVLLGWATPVIWIVLAFLMAGLSALDSSAESASVRSVVSENQMFRAMSLRQGRGYATMLLGPALGGVFIQFAGNATPFIAAVVGEGLAALLLILVLKTSDVPNPVTPDRNDTSDAAPTPISAMTGLMRRALAGAKLVIGKPVYRSICLFLLLISLGSGILFPLLTYSMTKANTPATIISSLSVASGIGGLLGTFVLNPLLDRFRIHVGMLAAVLTLLVAVLVSASGLIGTWWIYVALCLLVALASPPIATGIQSFISAYTPNEIQGRVFALINMSISIADAVAPAVAASMLHTMGIAAAMAVSGLLVAVAAFAIIVNRSVRDIPSSDQWKPYIVTLKTQEDATT